MGINFKLELDLDQKELQEAFQPRLNAIGDAMVTQLAQRGKELASQRLKSGLKLWERGFKVDKIEDGFFVVSMTGKLATMMEDGIKVGEISKMIMSGNRAKANKTGYVDVPIGRDADSLGNISGRKINVSAFKDADSLRQSVSFSDYKKGGIRKEDRIIQRVEDVIKSTEPLTGKSSFMTIRRVTEDSVWPSSPFTGAKIFEDLEAEVESIFNNLADAMI